MSPVKGTRDPPGEMAGDKQDAPGAFVVPERRSMLKTKNKITP